MAKIVRFDRWRRRGNPWRRRRSGAAFPLTILVLLLAAIAVVGYGKYLRGPPGDLPSLLSNLNLASSPPIAGRASIIDGDTIEIHGTRIRLFGIDAPESGQGCTADGKKYLCGQQAAFALSNKIGSHTVECRPKDRDRYGRVVAICFVQGDDLNGWMVAQGWALAYRHYSDDYVNQEQSAATAKRGMWQGKFESPWDWRRGHPRRSGSFQTQSPHQVIFYRPGGEPAGSYGTIQECLRAVKWAGNVGVCVAK